MQNTLFKSKPIADEQKLRGGYYTPVELARYLTSWAIRSGKERVLEPSCGDGNFVVAALGQLAEKRTRRKSDGPELVAIDVVDEELEKAQARAAQYVFPGLSTEWICEDFFRAYPSLLHGEPFDVVIGNPPFIRFQYFEAESRDLAFDGLRQAGYSPNKLANAWAAFVQLSIELLKEGGRLAMVVPAELLQVGYAGELRSKLTTSFREVTIVGFSELVFPEIQQEVVLLLADGKSSGPVETVLHTLEFANGASLPGEHSFVDAVAHAPSKHTRPGMKWTSLFLSDKEYRSLDEVEAEGQFDRLGELASVDVGVVTGRNSFFLLTEDQLDGMNAHKFVSPVVGRTNALKSIIFTKKDLDTYGTKNPAHMIDLKGKEAAKFPKRLREYISAGEASGVNQGYKCRIRKRWFDVPSIYMPDGFMFRQIHQYPMVVANAGGATSTDTIHRVRTIGDVAIQDIAFRTFNSLTFAWSEVCGRSYGGGVLELEPREAEELPVPRLEVDGDAVIHLDRLLRAGETVAALDFADDLVLRKGMGLSAKTATSIRSCWHSLRDRRINRR